jgi:hypothetical protein
MSEAAAVVAESQPAIEVPVMDVSRGPLVDITPEQRAEFRKTGNLPTPKTEDAAPSSEAKPDGEAKTAGDSEPPKKTQENTDRKPKQTAEERIAQLEATIEKIRKGSGKETPRVESSPTKPEPPKTSEPTPDDKNADGTLKFTTYEEYTKALARWEIRQEREAWQREQQEQAQAKQLNDKVADARTRYDNFDEVMQPALDAIVNDTGVSPVVTAMLNDSEVLPDLLFTIGSSKEDLASFVKMAKENPGKALRYIALTESLIADELSKKGEPAKTEEPPVKPRTQAPKPPSEAGGRAAAPPDALESAAKANDFRSFKTEANRRAIAKLKG